MHDQPPPTDFDSARLPETAPPPIAASDWRFVAWRWILGILTVGLVPLALLHPNRPSGPFEYTFVGYLYGTMLSQTTLAAGWAVLGTGKLARRMGFAALLVLAVVLAVVMNLSMHEHNDGVLLVLIVFGLVLFGQWLLAQVPLWCLVIAYGLRLANRHDPFLESPSTTRQFGIRQLMVVTAVVGVALGLGRILFSWVLSDDSYLSDAGEGFLIVGFIAAAGVVCILPLVLATLVARGVALAVTGAIVFLGLATWAELPVFQAVAKNTAAAGGPVLWHFAAINAFQAAWVLAITLLLRWGGYRLTMTSASQVT
jgi:hypothetical protein